MSEDVPLPFSHPVDVTSIRPDGLAVSFDANETERAGLAELFSIPAVNHLSAEFTLTRKGSRVKVKGSVSGVFTQTCVVTLDPFESPFHEDITLDFDEDPTPPRDDRPDDNIPDPIINGQIDLGAVAAEFTALALDPYPKKPGAVFQYSEDEDEKPVSPFAALAELKKKT